MYPDYAPIANFPVRNHRGHQVVVVEERDVPFGVIRLARDSELTTRDADGNEIFWIVFASNARRVWDLTEGALRREFHLRLAKASR